MEVNCIDQVGQSVPHCCGVPAIPAQLLSDGGSQLVHKCQRCSRVIHPSEGKKGVQGSVRLQMIDALTGEVVWSHNDPNVFTDVGRNYLASLISYAVLTKDPGVNEPADSKRRYDGIRYMMVGDGTQEETVAVSQLNSPLPYATVGATDYYLAQVVAPNELPGSGISARFYRVFGTNEISISGNKTLSEVGLFYSGPEGAELAPNFPTHPPVAYTTFDPQTKTRAFLFAVLWEIKF